MKSFPYIVASLLLSGLVASCSKPTANSEPQVIASFWRKVTPADSLMEGFRVIEAEGQTRYIVPIKEWTASPEVDTYHQLHHHGVALESDLMAYRIYFDRKQTIDVYAKKTPRIELPTSYWYPNDEQLADHYGDDVLRVSGTIGVGSVKPWKDGKMRHIEPVESRTQRIVYQTPSLRTTVTCVARFFSPSPLTAYAPVCNRSPTRTPTYALTPRFLWITSTITVRSSARGAPTGLSTTALNTPKRPSD